MNINYIIKNLKIILIISILISFMPTFCNAFSIDKIFEDGKGFLATESDKTIQNSVDDVKIIAASKDIYSILLTLGIIVAAIIIFVLGIQFMTGSIEQKAKVKEMLIPFIVGCIVVFGSLGIWKLTLSTMSNIFPIVQTQYSSQQEEQEKQEEKIEHGSSGGINQGGGGSGGKR